MTNKKSSPHHDVLIDEDKLYKKYNCIRCAKETLHIYCRSIIAKKAENGRTFKPMTYACTICALEYPNTSISPKVP